MTDRRHRERTLPEGYQFGDAAAPAALQGETIWRGSYRGNTLTHQWRRPSENAAEQLATKAEPPPPPVFLEQLREHGHWNVIEGEDH